MKFFSKVLILSFVLFLFCCSSCFAVAPSENKFLKGIDVSNWQGYVDYEIVKNAGIDVVYIEATIGSDYIDPYFELNYENAKLNGLYVGVYHYLTARSITEAEQEAEFFASVISGKQIDCRLAMDFENFGNLSNEQINDISIAFLNRLTELTGKETICYSDLSNAENVFDLGEITPLWIAYYGNANELVNTNTHWRKWQGQQYTDTGIVEGVSGYVDRDLFTSDVLLDDKSKIIEIENENSRNSERIEYTVQRGDTLWQIARDYNVSIDEIVRLNNIENPNYIYVGEKLSLITNTNFEKINGMNKTYYTVKEGNTLIRAS